MKKIYVLALGLIMISFSSCQFSENIYINEDGSGKMEFSFDASEIMQMAGDKMAKDGEKKMDSTISFKEFLKEKKDSISQLPKDEQEKLKALENFKFHMLMDPETKEMKIDMVTDFINVTELQDMFAALNNAAKLQNKKGIGAANNNNPFSTFGNGGYTDIAYSFSNNVFIRTATVKDEVSYKQMLDSLGDMSMVFNTSKYKLNYHFPKKIKSVSNDNVMFSSDRKSLTLEFGFMEYLKNPEALNLEVVLED